MPTKHHNLVSSYRFSRGLCPTLPCESQRWSRLRPKYVTAVVSSFHSIFNHLSEADLWGKQAEQSTQSILCDCGILMMTRLQELCIKQIRYNVLVSLSEIFELRTKAGKCPVLLVFNLSYANCLTLGLTCGVTMFWRPVAGRSDLLESCHLC